MKVFFGRVLFCTTLVLCMSMPAFAQSLAFTPTGVLPATQSVSYGVTFHPTGGSGTGYVFSLATGTLPAGITLGTGGWLHGTTTVAPASFAFSVKVTDSANNTLTQKYTLDVIAAPTVTARFGQAIVATVPSTAYGVHTSIYDNQLVNGVPTWGPLLTAIGVQGLRYPGGNDADFYHFSNNTVTPVYDSSTDSSACGNDSIPYFNTGNNFGAWLSNAYTYMTNAYASQGGGGFAIITTNYGSNVANQNASVDPMHPTCSNPATTQSLQAGSAQSAAAEVAYANSRNADTSVTIGSDNLYNWGTNLNWANLRTANTGCTTVLKGVDTADLCINHGAYSVKYWEVGNEIYGNGYGSGTWQEDLHAPYVAGDHASGRSGAAALSPTSYGNNAANFIQAMRAVDNTILIGTVVNDPTGTKNTNFTRDSLAAVCQTQRPDFVAFHYYPGGTGQWVASVLSDPKVNMTGSTGVFTAIRNKFSGSYKDANNTTITWNCKNAAGVGPDIFVTEANTTGGGAPLGGVDITTTNGWANITAAGQLAADMYLTFLEQGVSNIDWTELHNSTFIYNDTKQTPNVFRGAGGYYGIELAHQMAPVGASMYPCDTNDTQVAAILCHASKLPNGDYGLLISNIEAQINDNGGTTPPSGHSVSVPVTIGGVTLSGATATVYTYKNNGFDANGSPIEEITQSSVTGLGSNFTVTVPALGIVEYIIHP